jgi:hypothetical protein
MQDKHKERIFITSVAEKEIDLLGRHIDVLKTVRDHGPIGIIRLSQVTGQPQHIIRYSLRTLEHDGVSIRFVDLNEEENILVCDFVLFRISLPVEIPVAQCAPRQCCFTRSCDLDFGQVPVLTGVQGVVSDVRRAASSLSTSNWFWVTASRTFGSNSIS